MRENWDVSTPLHMDSEEFKRRLKETISEYNSVIEHLNAQRPHINPGTFGEGFTTQGQAIAQSVEHLHAQTLNRLQGRVRQFESMLALVADVERADDITAAELRAHE